MAKIVINGVVFASGNSINVAGGKIIVDGVEIENNTNGGIFGGVVELRILEGTIENLTADGSVTCGAVTGNVSAGGSVRCDDIGGDVNAGGSVRCDKITGRVNAGGSVRMG